MNLSLTDLDDMLMVIHSFEWITISMDIFLLQVCWSRKISKTCWTAALQDWRWQPGLESSSEQPPVHSLDSTDCLGLYGSQLHIHCQASIHSTTTVMFYTFPSYVDYFLYVNWTLTLHRIIFLCGLFFLLIRAKLVTIRRLAGQTSQFHIADNINAIDTSAVFFSFE